MGNKKVIKILLVVLFILIIMFLYRFISPNIEVSLMNSTDLAICTSIGVFVLSLVVTLIRSYK